MRVDISHDVRELSELEGPFELRCSLGSSQSVCEVVVAVGR